MTIRFRFVAPLLIVFAAGCGSSDTGAKAEAPAARPAAKKSATELRADELIADLQRREAAQAKSQQPVVNDVPSRAAAISSTPSGSSRPSGSTSAASYESAPAGGALNESDANRWRQEFSMAQARLQSATQQLEQARQRMNSAQSQTTSSNQALRRSAQDSYNRAQQEVSAAQSAVSTAQSAVDMARQNALNAGVSAAYLR